MIDNKKVIAITLARGGSRSIPKKNMADINGTPLLGYTINEVLKSRFIDEYYVSTDDEVTMNYCLSRGIKTINRPKELATDTATSADALVHAVEFMDCGYVVEVMATNPFKVVDDIDSCIEKLHNENLESVASVVRVYDHHPSRVKYLEKDVMKDFYPEPPENMRQDLVPAAYIRNGSVYAMKKSFLLDKKRKYNENTRAYIMPSERTINIDEPIDLELAKVMLSESK